MMRMLNSGFRPCVQACQTPSVANAIQVLVTPSLVNAVQILVHLLLSSELERVLTGAKAPGEPNSSLRGDSIAVSSAAVA